MDSRRNSNSHLRTIEYEPRQESDALHSKHATAVVCGMAKDVQDASFLLRALGLMDDTRVDDSPSTTSDGTSGATD